VHSVHEPRLHVRDGAAGGVRGVRERYVANERGPGWGIRRGGDGWSADRVASGRGRAAVRARSLTSFIAADGASSGFDRALSADDDLR
jgi:hypothetical protein